MKSHTSFCKLNQVTPSFAPEMRDTFPLMGIAAMMILNSHLESIYPAKWMAADGMLGNIIFFALSGYGVMISQITRPYGLQRFYARRIKRIFPSLWIVMALAMTLGLIEITGLIDALRLFVWPTYYGYIAHILIFYPIGWAVARKSVNKRRLILACSYILWLLSTLIASLILNTGRPIPLGQLPLYWWSTFFLVAYLTGCEVAACTSEQKPNVRASWSWNLLLVLAVILSYLAARFAFYLNPGFLVSTPAPLKGLVLQGFALTLTVILINSKSNLNQVLNITGISGLMNLLGRCSLQIYLCHVWIILVIGQTEWRWQLKLISIFFLSIVVARLIRFVEEWISQAMIRRVLRSNSGRKEV